MKRMGMGYFIMHQIRKIYNLSLHQAQYATQMSHPPQKNITPSEERGGKKVQKKTVRDPAEADGQN